MAGVTAAAGTDTMDRRDVVEYLLANRKRALVISGLGAPTYDVAAAGDDDRNFYLWGAMGSAATIGLGLALAQPDLPVLVITGDGEMLMGLGSLATIAARQPKNLTVIVVDNERFGETGGQHSHTALQTDLEKVAHGCGIENARTIRSKKELSEFAKLTENLSGPLFACIKVKSANKPRVLPIRDGVQLKERFRKAVLDQESAL